MSFQMLNAIVNAHEGKNFVSIGKVMDEVKRTVLMPFPNSIVIESLSVEKFDFKYIISIEGHVHNDARQLTLVEFVSDIEFWPYHNTADQVTSIRNPASAYDPEWVHDQMMTYLTEADLRIWEVMSA